MGKQLKSIQSSPQQKHMSTTQGQLPESVAPQSIRHIAQRAGYRAVMSTVIVTKTPQRLVPQWIERNTPTKQKDYFV